jgi:leucyl-tRNA synthetase
MTPGVRRSARRDVETMDTFVDSAWYYARYLDPRNEQLPFGREAADRWLPVDVYVGGPEHSTMHLLYFRFWTMVMKELGLVAIDEPVRQMITQGIVNGPDGRKMSKRWGNVVAPAAIVQRYGADAARTFVMFAGPPDGDIEWSDEQVEGSRFLLRVCPRTNSALGGRRTRRASHRPRRRDLPAAHKTPKRDRGHRAVVIQYRDRTHHGAVNFGPIGRRRRTRSDGEASG